MKPVQLFASIGLVFAAVLSPAFSPFSSSAARAQDRMDAAGQGMGGLSRASLNEPWALVTAPGVLALATRYDLSAGGSLSGDGLWRAQLAAVDSRTGPVALGIGGTYATGSPPPRSEDLPGWRPPDDTLVNPEKDYSVSVGAGVDMAQGHVGVGGSVWRSWRDTDYTDPEIDWNGAFSVGARPVDPVVLSLNVSELAWIFTRDDDAPLNLSLGGSWKPVQEISLGAELIAGVVDPSLPISWRAGVEGLVADRAVALRAGVERDDVLGTWYASGGLGYWSGKAGLDYSWRRDVGPAGGAVDVTGALNQHSLSARFKM